MQGGCDRACTRDGCGGAGRKEADSFGRSSAQDDHHPSQRQPFSRLLVAVRRRPLRRTTDPDWPFRVRASPSTRGSCLLPTMTPKWVSEAMVPRIHSGNSGPLDKAYG
jgi:hypothetical protein